MCGACVCLHVHMQQSLAKAKQGDPSRCGSGKKVWTAGNIKVSDLNDEWPCKSASKRNEDCPKQ